MINHFASMLSDMSRKLKGHYYVVTCLPKLKRQHFELAFSGLNWPIVFLRAYLLEEKDEMTMHIPVWEGIHLREIIELRIRDGRSLSNETLLSQKPVSSGFRNFQDRNKRTKPQRSVNSEVLHTIWRSSKSTETELTNPEMPPIL